MTYNVFWWDVKPCSTQLFNTVVINYGVCRPVELSSAYRVAGVQQRLVAVSAVRVVRAASRVHLAAGTASQSTTTLTPPR